LRKDIGLIVLCLTSARAIESEHYLTLLEIVNLCSI